MSMNCLVEKGHGHFLVHFLKSEVFPAHLGLITCPCDLCLPELMEIETWYPSPALTLLVATSGIKVKITPWCSFGVPPNGGTPFVRSY